MDDLTGPAGSRFDEQPYGESVTISPVAMIDFRCVHRGDVMAIRAEIPDSQAIKGSIIRAFAP